MDVPLPLVELIREYRHGIRIKSGQLQIRMGDEKYDAKINPGIWFIRTMPYVYKEDATLITTIIKRYDVKVGKIPMKIEEERFSDNLSILTDGGVELNKSFLPWVGCYRPIIQPDYIVIPRVRQGTREGNASDFALSYCEALMCDTSFRLLQAVLPIYDCKQPMPVCKIKWSEVIGDPAFHVQLYNVRKRDLTRIFPRLRKYQDARWLQFGVHAIILHRSHKDPVELKLNEQKPRVCSLIRAKTTKSI